MRKQKSMLLMLVTWIRNKNRIVLMREMSARECHDMAMHGGMHGQQMTDTSGTK
jgi:hypothetical protein